ncbi:hypothetical protein FGE12_23570 [Aggregicoccus sp. 17bor-14]|uniref:hypothetical protein n=1 Tax=Myxococcaceae TaxID=31 RepID=UPI00129C7E9F|nr:MULTISPECIES: hypothetical protein [Myxococcaceae]MBF5045406.1 hypothetical protein [Simulacricoccus sp. 17bor-14]MRI91147.1 hypothetical protein [Aggregicoccus sp. 17bor-14]
MLSSPSLDDAGVRALHLVHHQLQGDWAALRAQLEPAAPLQVDRLADAWADALGRLGELVAVEEPALHLGEDPTTVVVDVPLCCARGELHERVTFDLEGRVASIDLLAPR